MFTGVLFSLVIELAVVAGHPQECGEQQVQQHCRAADARARWLGIHTSAMHEGFMFSFVPELAVVAGHPQEGGEQQVQQHCREAANTSTINVRHTQSSTIQRVLFFVPEFAVVAGHPQECGEQQVKQHCRAADASAGSIRHTPVYCMMLQQQLQAQFMLIQRITGSQGWHLHRTLSRLHLHPQLTNQQLPCIQKAHNATPTLLASCVQRYDAQ
jgi:hypothetical protein